MTTHPTQQYQTEDVTRWISHRTLGKAQAYKSAVHNLEIGSTRITARVQGTQRVPYAVEVDFFRDFAAGRRVRQFAAIERRAQLRLDQLDAATALRDLDLPGNRLEALKGDRKGQYSVRINDQWRICFE